MVKTIKSKSLEIRLFDDRSIEIESQMFKDVAIEIKIVDPTRDINYPKGSIYAIWLYKPDEIGKAHPFEYDIIFVMPNGEIIHRKDRRALGV